MGLFNKKPVKFHGYGFRHALAISMDPTADYRADIGRPLSPEGVKQAEALRDVFKEYGVTFSVTHKDGEKTIVGAATAIRTTQTAAILAGCSEMKVAGRAIMTAPDSTGKKKGKAYAINLLYATHGDTHLRAYRLNTDDINDMNWWGERTFNVLDNLFLKRQLPGSGLFVGHGVLLQQTFFGYFDKSDKKQKEMQDELLLDVINKMDGFRITFVDRKPVKLDFIHSPAELRALLERDKAEAVRAAEDDKLLADLAEREREARKAKRNRKGSPTDEEVEEARLTNDDTDVEEAHPEPAHEPVPAHDEHPATASTVHTDHTEAHDEHPAAPPAHPEHAATHAEPHPAPAPAAHPARTEEHAH